MHVVYMWYCNSSQLEVNLLSLISLESELTLWLDLASGMQGCHSLAFWVQGSGGRSCCTLLELCPLTLRISWTGQLPDERLPWTEPTHPSWGSLRPASPKLTHPLITPRSVKYDLDLQNFPKTHYHETEENDCSFKTLKLQVFGYTEIANW